MAGVRIDVRGLTVAYGSAIAVAGIDLQVEPGEFVVLLGPSGCGKTSTMRAIAGLEEPQAGHIRLGEQVVFDSDNRTNVPVHKRGIGMVFQSYAVWPHRSVEENVGFPLRVRKVPRKEAARKVTEVLDLVGLADLPKRGASQLSGGQMQRVALARSLAMEPGVLLLDEPLSNLDAKLRGSLRTELKAIQQRVGLTTIFVTHDQTEALALADRIVVMREGRIVQIAPPRELYQAPADAFVADFLGVTNILDVAAVSTEGGEPLVSVPGLDKKLVSRAVRDTAGRDRVLALRPEDLVLERLREERFNDVEAMVEVASFLGSGMQYRVRVAERLSFDVVQSDNHDQFEVGQKVILHFPPERVQVLRRDALAAQGDT